MKNKLLLSLTCSLIIGGLTLVNESAEASEWRANLPESLNIQDGQSSYTLVFGDTLWAISQRVNLTVQTLADINGINLNNGEQYLLPVGRVIHFNGNQVTVTDNNGSVVSSTIVTDEQKVNSNQNVGETVDPSITTPTTNEETTTTENSTDTSEDTSTVPSEPITPTEPEVTEPPTEPSNPGEEGGTTEPSEPTEPTIPEGPYSGTIIPGANNGDVGTWTDKDAMMAYIEENWDAVSGGKNDYSMTTNGYGWIAVFY